ncbi:DUF1697 domain-containing protein [soil metagenome]
MTRYVAFLRAINIGGHTVRMDRLRALFEELRLGNVSTFIASGNVLFDSASKSVGATESRIERHLNGALGYPVATFLRPLAQSPTIAVSHPFGGFEAHGHSLSVGFLREQPGADVRERLAALETGYDEFHLHDRQVYWLCHGRMSDSKAWGAPLDKALGTLVTFRNITTVRRLAALSE